MPTVKPSAARDSYLHLVRRFPLRRLKNRQEHAEAVKVLRRVSLAHQGDRNSGILDYLDVLADLIDQFERTARLKADTSRTSPAGIVRHLMAANGLTVTELARQIGIGQSNLSEMLGGRRDFSKRAISGLRHRFGLNPEVFF